MGQAAVEKQSDVGVRGPALPGSAEILTPAALRFVAVLQREFNPRREELLAKREERKKRLDAGELPDFLPETKEIRESGWTVAPIVCDLTDRRVEITGPVDRKMIINALNSGANVFMADFEDANSPTWSNNIEGHINLCDAVRRTISFDSGAKQYKLNGQTATLVVRPRGWHLLEKHVVVDGEPVSASLLDFVLYFFHNAKELVSRGSGPYFYLPKMESHLEARLWNDVFATVLIETILASFEMHEILWELRADRSVRDAELALRAQFRARHDFITPDRASITMDKAFLAAYVDLLIATCHRRRIHAMGGMAAQIPIKNDEAADKVAFDKVRADKLREVRAGHDGTWVAHPALVPVAMEVFGEANLGLRRPGRRSESAGDASALLKLPEGSVTEEGVRKNYNVGVLYLESWLGGSGAVPLYNLMEDAATAEISRTQLWQWIHHGAKLDDGRTVDEKLYRRIRDEELKAIGSRPHIDRAARIFDELILSDTLADFLTIPAYDELLKLETP